MFDVSFGELLIIAIVALVVIGPEKLPKVARTLGLLAGRMQRYVTTVRADIERELQTQELQKAQAEVDQAIAAIESNVKSELLQVETPVAEAAQILDQAGKPVQSDSTPHTS